MRSGLSHTTQQRPWPISAIGKGRLRFLPAGMLPPFFLADEQCTKVATSVFHLKRLHNALPSFSANNERKRETRHRGSTFFR